MANRLLLGALLWLILNLTDGNAKVTPNIVIVLADDQGWADVGSFVNESGIANNSEEPKHKNYFTALNFSFLTEKVVLKIKPNFNLDEPINFVNIIFIFWFSSRRHKILRERFKCTPSLLKRLTVPSFDFNLKNKKLAVILELKS